MSKPEVYRPAKSIPVEGFTHPQVQGVPASVDGHPFVDGHISQFSVVAVHPNRRNGHEPALRRVSSLHGRSYEYISGAESNILWSDDKGNIFTALNSKGNNCEAVEVCRYDVAPSGFAYYGLQDSDSMVRVLKGSEILRANGVETEAVIKVIEPAHLPYKGKLFPIAEFKKKLVRAVWERDAQEDEKSKKMTDLSLAARADIPILSNALDKTVFFITVRGVQVNERLADFAKTSSPEERTAMLRKAFRYVNLSERQAALKDPEYIPQFFDLDNPQDLERYFREYLPQRIARNLAGIHNLELVHYFPHSSNISLVGSFYDLDSLKGEPLGLGDKEVSFEETKEDIGKCIRALQTLPFYPEVEHSDAQLVREREATIRQNFAEAYVEHAEWDQDVIEFFDGIAYMYGYFLEPAFNERANYYFARVFEDLNLQKEVDSLALLDQIDKEVDGWNEELRGLVTYGIAQDTFQKAVEALVAERIRNQYGKVHPGKGVYERSVSEFSRIFASKEALRVIRIMKDSTGEKYPLERDGRNEISLELSASFATNILNLYKRLVQFWGWEEDVIAHSQEINTLFYEFDLGKPYRQVSEYYRGLVVKQLGWDFTYEKGTEELIKEFHEVDQQSARWSVEQMLTDIATKKGEPLSDQEREVLVDLALIHSFQFGVDFSGHHKDRYNSYVLEEIGEEIHNQHGEDILRIGNRYGYGVERVVNEWLVKRYEKMFIDDMSDKAAEQLEQDTQARIDQLRKEFINAS